MKYITLNRTVIYPINPVIQHADFLAMVAGPEDVCTGAGFIKDGKCVGQSVGLGIGPDLPRDQILIEIMLDN